MRSFGSSFTLIAMLKLKINTDNQAFQPGEGYEVARILRKLATKIENDIKFSEVCQPLKDISGNTVGYYKTWTETEPLDEETRTCVEISSPYATWRQNRVDAVEGALGDYPEDCGW